MNQCLICKTPVPPETLYVPEVLWRVDEGCEYDVTRRGDGVPGYVAVRTLHGEGVMELREKTVLLPAGSFFCVDRRDIRRYRTREERWAFCWFEFHTRRSLPLPAARTLRDAADVPVMEDVADAMTRNDAEMLGRGFDYLMLRWLAVPQEPTDALAAQLKQALDTHPPQQMFCLADVARAKNVSERTLRDHFCRAYGASPREYWERRRLEMAELLLCSTCMPLREIAQRTGFENEFYFSNRFRRAFGTAPSRYRRSGR
ncbi:MAG: helix-turn-helix domain-containing protein [Eubacteriales bacterium]|nr:helix-turn-helix domain-containing protein [Eubacteriales bacterium]